MRSVRKADEAEETGRTLSKALPEGVDSRIAGGSRDGIEEPNILLSPVVSCRLSSSVVGCRRLSSSSVVVFRLYGKRCRRDRNAQREESE